MKTQHTPAPWSIGTNHHDENNNRIDIMFERGRFKDKAIVAMVRTTDSERAKVDARLIASAPDLLEVITEIDQVVIQDGEVRIVKNSAFHLVIQKVIMGIRG